MQLNIPPVIENIEEIKAIYDAEEKESEILTPVSELLQNMELHGAKKS